MILLSPRALVLLALAACASSPATVPDIGDDVATVPDVAGGDAEPPDVADEGDLPDAADTAETEPDEPDVVVGPVCGDGTCEDGESHEQCPSDCGQSLTAACLEEKCVSPLSLCLSHSDCTTTYSCLLGCGSDVCATSCMDAAAPDGLENVLGLFDCGFQAACFGDVPFCGDEVCGENESTGSCPEDCGDGPKCGDDLCGLGESPASCPEDCASGPPCGDGTCQEDESPESCPNDCTMAGCGDGACEGDETPDTCPKDCTAKSCVGKCGEYDEAAPCQCDGECPKYMDCCPDIGPICDSPVCGDFLCGAGELDSCKADCPAGSVCGDGTCDAGEECPGDCEGGACEGICEVYQAGAKCQCDAPCIGYGDCCEGYVALCTAAPECGNGVCELAETSYECPKDCAILAPLDCLGQKCPIAVCKGDDTCLPSLNCVAECPDSVCALLCTLQAKPKFQDAVADISGCATSEGCFATPAVCGDNICSYGETPESCVGDCPLPTICGDATCDLLETPLSCAVDCGDLSGVACITAKCPAGPCLLDGACSAALDCVAGCGDAACAGACVNAAPAEFQGLVAKLTVCARNSGCLGSGSD